MSAVRRRTFAMAVMGCAIILGTGLLGIQERAAEQSAPMAQQIAIYGQRFELYRALFTEPFESVLFLFKNGEGFMFTTHEEDGVSIPSSAIVEGFRDAGREIRDIMLIVHNHLYPSGFSMRDRAFYYYLKRFGFKGVYAIFYPASGNVRIYEDKDAAQK